MRLLTGLLLMALFGCEAEPPRISTESIKSINITICKHKDDIIGVPDEDFTLTIPESDWNIILDFILPYKSFGHGPNELRVGTAKITYKDKKYVTMDLFWGGKNPCLVSLDGKHFYYAKNIPGEADGACGLIRKAIAIKSQNEG